VGFGSSAQAERCDDAAPCSAVTVNQHLVFLETAKECTSEWRTDKGGHASPWCDRKRPMSSSRAWRHHAERKPLPNKANRRCAPASRPAQPDGKLRQRPARKGRPPHNCAPAPAPAQQPSVSSDKATLEAGQLLTKVPQKPMSVRHGRVGQPAVKGLSLRRNEELRHHEARCLHVRERSNRR